MRELRVGLQDITMVKLGRLHRMTNYEDEEIITKAVDLYWRAVFAEKSGARTVTIFPNGERERYVLP